jgi:hypothetical protein
MAIYEEMLTEIIKVQARIIGHGLALHLARDVKGMVINEEGRVVSFGGDPVSVMREVVQRYRKVERDVAITLAKKAIKPLLDGNPDLEIPAELK